MKLRHTSFWDIICLNAASASCSLIAGGIANGFPWRMPAGIVAWMRASSEGYPRTASMARMSASDGPTWRGTKESAEGNAGTDGAPVMGCEQHTGLQGARENSSPGGHVRALADVRRESVPSLGPTPAFQRAFARGSLAPHQ